MPQTALLQASACVAGSVLELPMTLPATICSFVLGGPDLGFRHQGLERFRFGAGFQGQHTAEASCPEVAMQVRILRETKLRRHADGNGLQ